MAFMLQDVIKELKESRSLGPLKKLKKENLVKAAIPFEITPTVGATKSHILDLIEDYCIENNIINELEEKPTAETVETADVLRLKLEFEREEWRLVCEEAQRAHDAKKALQDAQLAAQREARDLRLAELRKARELRELEFKAEQEKALLEAEILAKKTLLEILD